VVIKFHNSLSKKKEVFYSAKKKEVNIYVCGVTVYDYCHLGHARGAINFDVLRKFLIAMGYKVNFVKNYTDIDDKIIQQANKQGTSTNELTQKMILEHDKDMASLFVDEPDIAPKATENIEGMKTMIAGLIAKDFAYASGGDVFFRVKKFAEYGKLSGKKIADLQSGARVAINENKEDALDFVLWKASKPGEPCWESPWGSGRPGWHIECSCMCKNFVSGELDIHGGGADLLFPHHENEIAQSESLSQAPMANYWLHNGMIEVNGEKMSKSLDNFTKIRDLVIQKESNIYQGYEPRIIRFFILQSHYRQNLIFSEEALKKASKALSNIYYSLVLFEEQAKKKITYGEKIGRLSSQY
jgi:cysteinyl-tRNA synthetase